MPNNAGGNLRIQGKRKDIDEMVEKLISLKENKEIKGRVFINYITLNNSSNEYFKEVEIEKGEHGIGDIFSNICNELTEYKSSLNESIEINLYGGAAGSGTCCMLDSSYPKGKTNSSDDVYLLQDLAKDFNLNIYIKSTDSGMMFTEDIHVTPNGEYIDSGFNYERVFFNKNGEFTESDGKEFYKSYDESLITEIKIIDKDTGEILDLDKDEGEELYSF